MKKRVYMYMIVLLLLVLVLLLMVKNKDTEKENVESQSTMNEKSHEIINEVKKILEYLDESQYAGAYLSNDELYICVKNLNLSAFDDYENLSDISLINVKRSEAELYNIQELADDYYKEIMILSSIDIQRNKVVVYLPIEHKEDIVYPDSIEDGDIIIIYSNRNRVSI